MGTAGSIMEKVTSPNTTDPPIIPDQSGKPKMAPWPGELLKPQTAFCQDGSNKSKTDLLGESAKRKTVLPETETTARGGYDHTGFKAIGLSPFMISRCKEMGFTSPTGVQAACIPAILSGHNIIANSPTGTGKTFTFAIPIVQLCNIDPHPGFCLVLTPTRELASQIADQFRSICGSSQNVTCVIGGIDFQEQSKELATKPRHIIATPGRMADHFESNQVETKALLQNLKYLVIDEADRVLGGNFDAQLKTIIDSIPSRKRQTLFFSATMTEDLRVLAKAMSAAKEPFVYDYFENKPGESVITPTIRQHYIFSPADYKDGYFIELLRMIRDNEFDEPVRSMIVFAPTCKDCNLLGAMMKELNFKNLVLHSHLRQKERLETLAAFKARQVTTLIATDVASRGLDIQSVDLVVNYHVPFATDYIHRIGRAGRGGQNGVAITLVTSRDVPLLHAIEASIEEKLTEIKINERSVLLNLNEINATKRTVALNMGQDPYDERMKLYERKRHILAGLEIDSDTSSSDEPSIEDLKKRRKPKRAKTSSQLLALAKKLQ